MATLSENVAKVVAAHGALKEAIAAKGVDVPEGVKLSDMAALVDGIDTGIGAVEVDAGSVTLGNTGLTTLDVPAVAAIDLSKVTSLKGCFESCVSLTSLTLPEGFGRDADDLRSCFGDCWYLASLTLPEGFGQNATRIGSCFSFCTSLTSLTLPDGFGKKVTSATECFNECSALADITGAILFRCSFDLSSCTNLTHDSLMNVINGLVEVSGQTLTLGSANLAKLTDEEKAIATGKGWTLA